MGVFLTVAAAVAVVVGALRLKLSLGSAIALASACVWVMGGCSLEVLAGSVRSMVLSPRTYNLFFALYFVVCLEIELKKSGALAGLLRYLERLTPSKKFTLALMPAFIGLLPSMGGARFSAPIVEGIAQGEHLSAERLASINYWFRHVPEFCNPIVPGCILACSIANIEVGDLILRQSWVSALAALISLAALIAPLRLAPRTEAGPAGDMAALRREFWLALLPVLSVIVLMLALHLSAAAATGAVAAAMVVILKLLGRPVTVWEVFGGAIEKKLFCDVGSILLFVSLLETGGLLQGVCQGLSALALPVPVTVAAISFVIGLLTGTTPAIMAIAIPVVVGLCPQGSVALTSVAVVFGVGGQLITPVHMCLTISLDYFKADFFRVVGTAIAIDAAMLAVYSLVSWLTWPAT